jgi:hypothetical protein
MQGRPGKPRRPFSFPGVHRETEKPARLLVGGACIRAAKVADRKSVWATAHAQVRVLPLPPENQMLGDRLMAGRQALTLSIEVRFLVPEPVRLQVFDNRIAEDAPGRTPIRLGICSCSRSGDGAWLKSRRCWFDSRREHHQGGARVDERRFREPEVAGADPATLTSMVAVV